MTRRIFSGSGMTTGEFPSLSALRRLVCEVRRIDPPAKWIRATSEMFSSMIFFSGQNLSEASHLKPS